MKTLRPEAPARFRIASHLAVGLLFRLLSYGFSLYCLSLFMVFLLLSPPIGSLCFPTIALSLHLFLCCLYPCALAS